MKIKNEHICATALYYYDNHNITPSHLAFRQQTSSDDIGSLPYEQDDFEFVSAIFGMDPRGVAVQNVGSILCKEGRLITFPNTLQHQVQSFKLADPAKPGHRKLLALFLVDPNIKVVSTANVIPQRPDWWDEKLEEASTQKGSTGDFPISFEEAKDIRMRLMEERVVRRKKQNDEFEWDHLCLCEH